MLSVMVAITIGRSKYFTLNYRFKKMLTYYINMLNILITKNNGLKNIQFNPIILEIQINATEENYDGSDDDDEILEEDYDYEDGFVVKD